MINCKDRARHQFNPLHVFCRLLNLRMPYKTALRIARWYERAIFLNLSA